MKKTLLCMVLIAFTPNLRGQDYIPLLEEGNTWSIDIYFDIFEPIPPDPCCYTITEQLVVGEIIEFDGVEYIQMYYDDIASCLLREENGIVYKYDSNTNIDKVLIDMNLEVGDTFDLIGSAYDFTYPFCNSMYGALEYSQLNVSTVEMLDIAGAVRKVITFQEWGSGTLAPIQWIEGIGNTTGFDSMWGAIDITAGQALVCFTNSSDTYFFNGATMCDNTTLGISNNHNDSEVILYPNPVATKSILQFSRGSVDHIIIYNTTGKLITEFRPTSNNIVIDSMVFTSGLYFFQAFSGSTLVKTDQFIIY